MPDPDVMAGFFCFGVICEEVVDGLEVLNVQDPQIFKGVFAGVPSSFLLMSSPSGSLGPG